MDIQIEWQLAIHRDDREALRKHIVDRLRHWGELEGKPGRVVVSRPSFDPYDQRLVLEIQSDTGKTLGASRVAFQETWGR